MSEAITDHDRYLMGELYEGGKGLTPGEIGKKWDIPAAEVKEALGITAKRLPKQWPDEAEQICKTMIDAAIASRAEPDVAGIQDAIWREHSILMNRNSIKQRIQAALGTNRRKRKA